MNEINLYYLYSTMDEYKVIDHIKPDKYNFLMLLLKP